VVRAARRGLAAVPLTFNGAGLQDACGVLMNATVSARSADEVPLRCAWLSCFGLSGRSGGAGKGRVHTASRVTVRLTAASLIGKRRR
jgi:hypothetical protein